MPTKMACPTSAPSTTSGVGTWFIGQDLPGVTSSAPPRPAADAALASFLANASLQGLPLALQSFDAMTPTFLDDGPASTTAALKSGFNLSGCFSGQVQMLSTWLQSPYCTRRASAGIE